MPGGAAERRDREREAYGRERAADASANWSHESAAPRRPARLRSVKRVQVQD